MSWLVSNAEEMLHKLDQIAADNLTPQKRKGEASDGDGDVNGDGVEDGHSMAPAAEPEPSPLGALPAAGAPAAGGGRSRGAAERSRGRTGSRSKEVDGDALLFQFLNQPSPAAGPAASARSGGSTSTPESPSRRGPSSNGAHRRSQSGGSAVASPATATAAPSRATPNGTGSAGGPTADSANGGRDAPSAGQGGEGGEGGAQAVDAETEELVQRNGELATENRMLRNEISALEDEVASFSTRVRSTKDSLADVRDTLAATERKLEMAQARERQLVDDLSGARRQVSGLEARAEQLENDKALILKDQADSGAAQAQAVDTLKDELATIQRAQQAKADTIQETSEERTAEIAQLTATVAELESRLAMAEQQTEQSKGALTDQVERCKLAQQERDSVQQEFADYKARATRVLQTKEKLLADLKSGAAASGGVGVTSDEMDALQLQREKEALEESLSDANLRVQQLQQRAREVEEQQDADASYAEEHMKNLEVELAEVRQQLRDTEARFGEQERQLQATIEGLSRQKNEVFKQLGERDATVVELRGKLTRKAAPSQGSAELENRIHSLTDNLIQKQSKIESLTAETTALTLQLETERRKNVELQMSQRVRETVIPMDPFEDARVTSIKSVLRSTPADGKLSKNLKNAVTFLDSVSIQIGRFLRRYPMARIVVICYMLLLHLWVMIVLLTYTPELHGSHLPQPAQHPNLAEHLD